MPENQIAETQLSSREPAADALWSLHRKMFQIRRIEESMLELYSRGVLFGTVHTCIGQESGCVGVAQALQADRDVVWSNHRGHGHYLAFTGDLQGLTSEILGKRGGVCGGIGGSQHLHRGGFYSNGILGGTIPSAVGCAFAEKYKQTGGVAVVFMGDGALGEGIVYESFNIAALWELPILFVLEDNGYAQSTPKRYEHAGDLATRTASFGIPATRLSASDVLEVCRVATRIVGEIRHNSRPQFLALDTYRLSPHSKGDDNRDPEEIAAFQAIDPLRVQREQLRVSDPDRLDDLEREVNEEIERCIATAMADEAMDLEQFLSYRDLP
jgi:TPP-dependent pyruvate/acetoin dehydrogenase alpha subunit